MAGFTIPTEVIEKHLGTTPNPAAEASPPAEQETDKADAPVTDPEDNELPETGDEPEDDALDSDDDGSEEQETDEDEATPDGKDDKASDEEDIEPVLERVSADDLKRIQADPALSKIHKQMQADYTRKQMERANRELELDERENVLESLRTPEGMSTYIKDILESHPLVVGHAFEAAASGASGEEFLVAIGRAKPEVLEKAYERVQEMLADPASLQAYDRKQQLDLKETQVALREEQARRQAFDTDFMQLGSVLEAEARRAGIRPGDDLVALKERFVDAVRMNGNGRIVTTKEEVRRLVAETKSQQDKVLRRARAQVEREVASKSQQQTKQIATRAKEPVKQAPRGVARQAPPEVTQFKVPAGKDPLRAFIEHKVGL